MIALVLYLLNKIVFKPKFDQNVSKGILMDFLKKTLSPPMSVISVVIY